MNNNNQHHHNNIGANNMNVHSYSNNANNNNSNINNKDVAPRFKRNIVPPTSSGSVPQQQSGNNINNLGGTNGDHLNELQMRPTPNSLLYKYNMNLKPQIQLPLQPPQTLNNNAKNNSYNNHRNNDFTSNSGGQMNNSSYITPPSSGLTLQQKQELNVKNQSTGLTITTKPQLITTQATTPINNILQKDQIPIKQISADKLNKQNKNKDKGPNKNDIMKKVNDFINDTLVLQPRLSSSSPTLITVLPIVTPILTIVESESIDSNKENSIENAIENALGNPEINKIADINTEDMKVNHEDILTVSENIDVADENVSCNTIVDDIEDEEKEKNIEEIVQLFDDLKVPDKFFKDSIIKIINEMLEKNDINQIIQVTEFLLAIRNRNRLTNNQLLDAFKTIINSINEKEKTIPKITTHIATLLSQSIMIKLCKLNDIAKITENGQYYPLFLLLLQQLHRLMGKQQLQDMFNASKINLMLNLPECDRTKDRMAEILEDRSLSFLYPLLRVQAELWKQIQTDPNPQQFYKWIKENIDPQCYTDSGFITAMMTVLLKYITLVSNE